MRELAVRPLLDDPLDAVTWLGDITAVVRAKSPGRPSSLTTSELSSVTNARLAARARTRAALRRKAGVRISAVPSSSSLALSASMNEGPLSSPLCFGGTERACERLVAGRHGCRRSPDRTGCRRILRAAGGVAGWSGAHLSIASSTSRTRCYRCSLRRRNSKMDCHAVRAKMAPAGAKGLNGWLRVSMYQIASVSFLASSIWATLAPR